jgi:hypothetical protein
MSISKIIFPDSFDYSTDYPLVELFDNPDTLRKQASTSNPFVEQWKDIRPQKNASLVHIIALGDQETVGCNRNADAFPASFCRDNHGSFIKTAQLYRHHKMKPQNSDGKVRASGYNQKQGRVELLLEADHSKCSDWLTKLEGGQKVAFSMGLKCKKESCSHCHNVVTFPGERCEHLNRKVAAYWPGKIMDDGSKIAMINEEGDFNDISFVDRPADMTAYSLRKVAGLGGPEVITGEDLAKAMGYGQTDSCSKFATLVKMADIEKRIPTMAWHETNAGEDYDIYTQTKDIFKNKTANEILGHFANKQCILPLEDFYKVIMGSKYAELDPYIEGAKIEVQGIFNKIASDPETASSVCGNASYDPMIPTSSLPAASSWELEARFGLSTGMGRLMKTASLSSMNTGVRKIASTSEQSKLLALEYAAYKVAAIDAIEKFRGAPTSREEVWVALESV